MFKFKERQRIRLKVPRYSFGSEDEAQGGTITAVIVLMRKLSDSWRLKGMLVTK